MFYQNHITVIPISIFMITHAMAACLSHIGDCCWEQYTCFIITCETFRSCCDRMSLRILHLCEQFVSQRFKQLITVSLLGTSDLRPLILVDRTVLNRKFKSCIKHFSCSNENMSVNVHFSNLNTICLLSSSLFIFVRRFSLITNWRESFISSK